MPFMTKLDSSGSRIKDSFATKLQVRAILAFMFSLGLIIGFFMGLIGPEDYKEIAMIAIVWYFSKRQTEDNDLEPSPSAPKPLPPVEPSLDIPPQVSPPGTK